MGIRSVPMMTTSARLIPDRNKRSVDDAGARESTPQRSATFPFCRGPCWFHLSSSVRLMEKFATDDAGSRFGILIMEAVQSSPHTPDLTTPHFRSALTLPVSGSGHVYPVHEASVSRWRFLDDFIPKLVYHDSTLPRLSASSFACLSK